MLDKSRVGATKTLKVAKGLSIFVPNALVLNNALRDNIEAALVEIVKIRNVNL